MASSSHLVPEKNAPREYRSQLIGTLENVTIYKMAFSSASSFPDIKDRILVFVQYNNLNIDRPINNSMQSIVFLVNESKYTIHTKETLLKVSVKSPQ